MANLSKPAFFDAGKHPPRTRIVTVDGQRRKESYPNGMVERWVDPRGNVVWQQLVAPGVPVSDVAVDNSRASIRRRPGGWLEHHRCPLSQGTAHPDDFPEELQTICKVGTYGRDRACRHVEHIIAERQTAHAEARAARHAVINADKLRRQALEAEGVEQTRQLNQTLMQILGDAAHRAAAPPEPAAAIRKPSSAAEPAVSSPPPADAPSDAAPNSVPAAAPAKGRGRKGRGARSEAARGEGAE